MNNGYKFVMFIRGVEETYYCIYYCTTEFCIYPSACDIVVYIILSSV